MSKITQGKFKILSNRRMGPEYFKMTICAPTIAQRAHPGQFVHLRCNNGTGLLLRRPFSFHRINQHNFEILYKVVGLGTNLLAKKKKGDIINILGPLGNGFDLKLATSKKRLATILVAGGMGVAPLLALAENLAERKNIFVLIGAKTKAAILCAEDFEQLGARLQLATDDGSKGHKAPVTELLKRTLRETTNEKREATIYACGPKPMLKEVARISKRLRISAWASFEENMACGIGACLGCVIETSQGYKRVCKDGPGFNLGEIIWKRGVR